MNQTIEKIVGLLFEDIEETEEVRAIHDEVLTNCQERYDDLRQSGLDADEATHAVIESLKGMEDMLKAYPRKNPEPAEEPRPLSRTFDPAEIREIDLQQMHNADVAVEPSSDAMVHVSCSDAKCEIIAQVENGVLTILRSDRKTNVKANVDIHSNSLGAELDWNNLGGLFDTLIKKLVRTASQLCGITVTVQIPQHALPHLRAGVASGDVDIRNVRLQTLAIRSAAGDIHLEGVTVVQEGKLSSASGDIDIENLVSGEGMQLSVASGDIQWSGCCPAIAVNTVSGDVHLDGEVEECTFNTTSGDAHILLRGECLRLLKGHSCSGDVTVALPMGVEAAIRCHTTNGDIRQRTMSVEGSSVRVEITTLSGDISIK